MAETATEATGYRIVWDDFSGGFATEGPDARWATPPFPPGVGTDGVATVAAPPVDAPGAEGGGLRVASAGVNPTTGEPAFAATVGHDHPAGLPGTLDHVKWLVFARHLASSGQPGFDAVDGHELACEAWFSGRTCGTAGHPVGAGVAEPDDDLRLASVGLPFQDPETALTFNFHLTNSGIYAFYERLPHHRGELGRYASFLYAVPVARRSPGDEHHLGIAYDRSAGVVRWLVEGEEAFRVDRIGHRLPSSRYAVFDLGGEGEDVAPRQLNFGLGIFAILDGAAPGHADSGLVRLAAAPDYYFSPAHGEPTPATFADDASRPESRLFGQGAELRVRRYVVSSTPVAR
jgi:hypothetical protein